MAWMRSFGDALVAIAVLDRNCRNAGEGLSEFFAFLRGLCVEV